MCGNKLSSWPICQELYYWENASEEEGVAYKVTYDFTDPYPFMLVNIGKDTSFLLQEYHVLYCIKNHFTFTFLVKEHKTMQLPKTLFVFKNIIALAEKIIFL